MAAELATNMSAMSLNNEESKSTDTAMLVKFKVHGMDAFELKLEASTCIREVKKLLRDESHIEPEHMRLIYKDKVLKDAETLEAYNSDGKLVQVLYTAGHSALMGGTKPTQRTNTNPFVTPVRGIPGSKGERPSRMSGRRGGMALIRKYGILMKRQEFREKAPEIGFIKYR